VRSKDQPILQKKGDDLRIDWGCLYVAAERTSAELVVASFQTCRETFVSGGSLPEAMDRRMPRAASDDTPVAAFAFDLGKTSQHRTRYLMLAYDDAKKYRAIAQDYAARWQDLARGDGRTLLAYGQPDTWAMKHNLIWDRVLGLNLFPQSIGDAEIAWYLEVQKTYGLPVDNRTDTCLIDWALWSIALARRAADF